MLDRPPSLQLVNIGLYFARGFARVVSQLCSGLSFQLRTGLVPHGVMRVRLVPDGVKEMPSRPPARIRVMV